MKRLAATAVVGVLLALPSASAAKSGCPTRDVRTMLAEAGQGMNGRVIALHETYITVVAESSYEDSISFDETVRVYGTSLPGVLQGRIGGKVRRRQFSQPGTAMIVEGFTYSAPGRFHAKIRAEGGFGPGCGTSRRRYSTAEKTIVIR
jgi:hypothetical protein